MVCQFALTGGGKSTPRTEIPDVKKYSSNREQLLKGDNPMGKICSFAVAVVIVTSGWAVAGNFEVLGGAAMAAGPTPIYIKPGTIVRADFKSTMKTSSDVGMESDAIVPEKVSAKNDAAPMLKPAVSYKEASTRAMAPPPRLNPSASSPTTSVAEAQDSTSDLEADLEKDLVLSPPPPRAEEEKVPGAVSESQKKPSSSKVVASDKKSEKKKATVPSVKKMTPPVQEKFAISAKPIQKVRPTANNSWLYPAGNYQAQACPVNPTAMMSDARRANSCRENRPAGAAQNRPIHSNRGPELMPPPSVDRFVRDGVTIKLAPAAAGPSQPMPEEESAGSDILSTAAEIIGMPFAFISSFF